MRTDTLAIQSNNLSSQKQPFIVVELSFDDANTDLLYLTSHTEADTPDGATVIPAIIEKVSGTSQSLDLKNFNSTIGSLSIDLIDIDETFSNYLSTKYNAGKAITNKRVRVYLGYPDVDFADYALIQTQIIEKEERFEAAHTLRCYDIQRAQRKTIFERKETVLTADLLAGNSTSISVNSTEGFETYWHGPSYSANTNSVVGHLLIVDGDKYEKITYTGKTATTFTGITRGAFGTTPIDFLYASNGKTRNVKVYEYIYIEMPAVKVAYALLTGTIYGTAYELPAHWHLGIDSQYIATANFTGIGADWWDTTDDTKGRIVRFEGLKKTEGKTFIERELYALLGAFSPILSTGEMGLKRLAAIVSTAAPSRVLDESNIIKASRITYNHKDVVNFVRINWGYDENREEFRRVNYFVDPDSRDLHGLSGLKVFNFKGLKSIAGHSTDSVRSMFDGFRDRFAGPPIKLTLTLLPSLNVLEVGDVVRVDLSNYKDYFLNSAFSRSMEVQQVSVDWATGRVNVTLIGSTQKASPLVSYEGDETIKTGYAIPDAKYTADGTNIETAFAGNVSRSGSIVTVDSDFTITGTNDVNSSGSIFYVNGDFTIPFGRTLTIEKNVQLRVKGFFNCYGKIDGKGRGHAGEDYRRYSNNIEYFVGVDSHKKYDLWPRRINESYPSANDPANNFFVKGYARSATAVFVYAPGRVDQSSRYGLSYYNNVNTASQAGGTAAYLTVNPATLEGLPAGLWGQGGTAGDPLFYSLAATFGGSPTTYHPVANGGNGGNGGAGLAIFSRGMDFGAGGIIDLSGANGGEGEFWNDVLSWYPEAGSNPVHSIKASDGAPGHAGLCYIFIDGATSTAPIIDGNIIQENGIAPDQANTWNPDAFWVYYINSPTLAFYLAAGFNDPITTAVQLNRRERDLPYPRTIENNWEAFSRVQFLIEPTDAEDEPVDFPEQPLGISSTVYENYPETPDGDQVTIDLSVTPPSPLGNYSHSIIEAQKVGANGWQVVGIANDEVSFVTALDGSSWVFRALGVSDTGATLATGPTTVVNLNDIATDFASVRPAIPVTGLRLTSQGAGTTFATRDLQFTWNLDNIAGAGYLNSWFSHFKVEIRQSNGTLLFTETTPANVYTLTYSENAALPGGPFSSIQVRVSQVTLDGVEGSAANVTFTNGAPGAPSALSASPSAFGAEIKWTNPSDIDLEAVELYASTSAGFTPSAANLVFNSFGYIAQLSGLASNTTYYYKARARDAFGNYSGYTAEQSFTTSGVSWNDLSDIPPGTTETLSTYFQPTEPGTPSDGDLWFDTSSGNLLKRFNGSVWELAQDDAISDAAQAAADAQTTADGKIVTFIQGTQPTADGIGDLWIDTANDNRLKRWNGSAWEDASDTRIQDALDAAADAQITADGKITTFYQATAPTVGVDNGDLWFDTSDGRRLYIRDGGVWVDGQDSLIGQAITDAQNAQNTANGKNVTFFDAVEPTPQAVGDLWVDTSDNNHLFRWNGSIWQSTRDATIAIAQATAEAKIQTFVQGTQPTATAEGDLWIDTASNSRLKRWNGSVWEDISDDRIGNALQAAQDAQDTADGKIVTFAQTSAPSGAVASLGDLWIDTTPNVNRLYRYDGSIWEPLQDGDIGTALANATAAQNTANGKATTFFATSEPTAEAVGDLWYNDNDKTLKRWNGSAWVGVSTFGADWNSTVDGKPSDEQLNKNELDLSQWVVGTSGSQGSFIEYLSAYADNSIVFYPGPDGEPAKCWQIDFNTYPQGGFTTYLTEAAGQYDTSQAYRVSGFAYFSAGSNRLWVRSYEDLLNADGSAHDGLSPDDMIDASDVPAGEWLFFVAFVNPFSWTGPQSGKGGVYRVSNGEKIHSELDYKLRSTATQFALRLRFVGNAGGKAYISKLRVERVSDAMLPIVSMIGSADNTQTQIDSGAITGLDYYDSGSIFLRIIPRVCGSWTVGSHSTVSQNALTNTATLTVDTNQANQWDYAQITYMDAGGSTAHLGDWNTAKDRRFKFSIDYSTVFANQNKNIMMSWSSMGYYRHTSGGTLEAVGFGFYAKYDSVTGDMQLYGFAQTSSTKTNPPATVAFNIGINERLRGKPLVLEAEYIHNAKMCYFRILTDVVGAPVEQSISLGAFMPSAALEEVAFHGVIQKIDTQADSTLWQDYYIQGPIVFHQK